jgi:NADPH:quinone reductase-like Zn-dependent oxidoreductase
LIGERTKGVVVGFDYAGYVEEVGPDVKKPFRKRDRVLS